MRQSQDPSELPSLYRLAAPQPVPCSGSSWLSSICNPPFTAPKAGETEGARPGPTVILPPGPALGKVVCRPRSSLALLPLLVKVQTGEVALSPVQATPSSSIHAGSSHRGGGSPPFGPHWHHRPSCRCPP